jgi:hypothetical protein
MRSGSKPDYKKFALSVTKTGKWRSPVSPVHELFLLLAGNLCSELHEPRAASARNDLLPQFLPF